MIRRKQTKYLGVILTALFWIASGVSARAQTSSNEAALIEQVQELEVLKQTDPEAFQRIVSEKREALKEKFQRMREGDQERFGAFVKKERTLRQGWFKRMRERDPGTFNQFVNRRMQRMQEMETKNPERFGEWMGKHPRFKQRYEQFKQAGPGAGSPPGFRPEGGPRSQGPSGGPMDRKPGPGFHPQEPEKKSGQNGPGIRPHPYQRTQWQGTGSRSPRGGQPPAGFQDPAEGNRKRMPEDRNRFRSERARG